MRNVGARSDAPQNAASALQEALKQTTWEQVVQHKLPSTNIHSLSNTLSYAANLRGKPLVATIQIVRDRLDGFMEYVSLLSGEPKLSAQYASAVATLLKQSEFNAQLAMAELLQITLIVEALIQHALEASQQVYFASFVVGAAQKNETCLADGLFILCALANMPIAPDPANYLDDLAIAFSKRLNSFVWMPGSVVDQQKSESAFKWLSNILSDKHTSNIRYMWLLEVMKGDTVFAETYGEFLHDMSQMYNEQHAQITANGAHIEKEDAEELEAFAYKRATHGIELSQVTAYLLSSYLAGNDMDMTELPNALELGVGDRYLQHLPKMIRQNQKIAGRPETLARKYAIEKTLEKKRKAYNGDPDSTNILNDVENLVDKVINDLMRDGDNATVDGNFESIETLDHVREIIFEYDPILQGTIFRENDNYTDPFWGNLTLLDNFIELRLIAEFEKKRTTWKSTARIMAFAIVIIGGFSFLLYEFLHQGTAQVVDTAGGGVGTTVLNVITPVATRMQNAVAGTPLQFLPQFGLKLAEVAIQTVTKQSNRAIAIAKGGTEAASAWVKLISGVGNHPLSYPTVRVMLDYIREMYGANPNKTVLQIPKGAANFLGAAFWLTTWGSVYKKLALLMVQFLYFIIISIIETNSRYSNTDRWYSTVLYRAEKFWEIAFVPLATGVATESAAILLNRAFAIQSFGITAIFTSILLLSSIYTGKPIFNTILGVLRELGGKNAASTAALKENAPRELESAQGSEVNRRQLTMRRAPIVRLRNRGLVNRTKLDKSETSQLSLAKK